MTDLEEGIRASLWADAQQAPRPSAAFTPRAVVSHRGARPTGYRLLIGVAAMVAIVVGAIIFGQRSGNQLSTTDLEEPIVAYLTAVPDGYELSSARVAIPGSTLQLPADARSATLRRGNDLVRVQWFPYERADYAVTGRPIDVGPGAVATVVSDDPLSVDLRTASLSASLHGTTLIATELQELAGEIVGSRSIDIPGWQVSDETVSAAVASVEYLLRAPDTTASAITVSAYHRSTLPDGGEPVDVNGADGVLLDSWLSWQADAGIQLEIRGPVENDAALDRDAMLRLARSVVIVGSRDATSVASAPGSIQAAVAAPIEYRTLDSRTDPTVSSWLIGVHSLGSWCPGLQIQKGARGSQGFVGPPCSLGDARLVGERMVGLLPPGTAAAHFEIERQGPLVPATLVEAPDGNVFAYATASASPGASSVRIVADSTG